MAKNIRKMSLVQLERHIRGLASETACIAITSHAKQRMRQRKVIAAEVFQCLQAGRLMSQPEEDLTTGWLKCRMECYGSSRNLSVVAAIEDQEPTVIVVTVIT